MSHLELIAFFFQIAVMLAVGLIFRQIMVNLHLPGVIGELIGGILLGPTVFAVLAPATHAWLFPNEGPIATGRTTVVNLGMLFFLLSAGLEMDLTHLRRRGLTIAWTSIFGIVVPFALGFGLVLLMPELWGPPAQRNVKMFALFLGTALSISALPVIARIMMDLGLIKRSLGVVVMSAAMIDDLIGWSLFAVILSNFRGNGTPAQSIGFSLFSVLLLFATFLSVGRWFGQRTFNWFKSHPTWPGGFIALTFVLVLVAAGAAEFLGIHAVFGAFLVGVALAQNSAKRDQAHEVVYQFVDSFFSPLYFVSIGLRANFVANFDLSLVVLVTVVACAGKILGVGFGAWLGKFPPKESLAVGFGMNARGAMVMILASVALEHKLIDTRIFVALIIMALVTSILSGPIMQWLLKGSSALEGHSCEVPVPTESSEAAPVIRIY